MVDDTRADCEARIGTRRNFSYYEEVIRVLLNDETCCRFFDDGASVLENYKDFWITDSQYHILKNFWDKFEAFADDNHWPHKFIDTPEWNEITEMAKEVLKVFNYEEQRTKP